MKPYAKRMTVRYMTVLILVAALSLVSFLLQSRYDNEQQHNLAAIQLSEQQRNLAKRAGLLSFRLILTDSTPEQVLIQRELQDIATRMTSIHASFTEGNQSLGINAPDEGMMRILHHSPAFLEREVVPFVDAVDQLSTAPLGALHEDNPHYQVVTGRIIHGQLSHSLDRLIAHYQAEGYQELTERRTLRNASIIVGLLLLLVAGAFILHPMTRRVEQDMVLLDESRARAEAAETYAQFLADASRALTSSLDQGIILDRLCHLIVPFMADYCVIDAVTDEGRLERLATAHVDPDKEKMLVTTSRYTPAARAMRHLEQVFHTRKTVLISDVDPADKAHTYDTALPREMIRKMDPQSILFVPLGNEERTLGILTLAYSESGRRYQPGDEEKAEEISRRTLLALDNARLYQETRQAVQARNEILSVVSHDLRNPLSVVLTTAGALLNPPKSFSEEAKRKFLLNLKHAAERMNRLIQDLLDMSRLEAGQLPLRCSQHSPTKLTQEVVDVQSTRANEKGVELSWDMENGLPHVFADADRLQQALTNLLDNSIKFTPSGGRVEVRVTHRDGRIWFEVADTGPGIPSEIIEHIFDRYWQAHISGRAGAGLGLAIVKGIVEAHQGTITVTSEPGMGTTICFSIPVDDGGRPVPEHCPPDLSEAN